MTDGRIYGHFAKWCGIVSSSCVYRYGIEPHLMAGTDEEYPFVMFRGIYAGVGRSGYLARIDPSGVRHDHGLNVGTLFALEERLETIL